MVSCDSLGGSPLDFVYAGFYDYSDGSRGGVGSVGYCWSRTALAGTGASGLYLRVSGVSTQASRARGYGYALRCVGLSATSYPRFLPSLGDFVGKLVALVIVEVLVTKAWKSY